MKIINWLRHGFWQVVGVIAVLGMEVERRIKGKLRRYRAAQKDKP